MPNKKYGELAVRILTAFVGVAVIGLLYYFFRTDGLYIASVLVSLLVGYEAGEMCFDKKESFLPLLLINACWFIYFYFFIDISSLFAVLIFSVTAWTWISRFKNLSKEQIFKERSNIPNFILFSLVCPTFVIGHLNLEGGVEKFAYLLASVFLFDTLSFFYGKTLGGKFFKTPLYPAASPSKTIEGALFAMLTCTFILILIEPHTYLFSPFSNFSTPVKFILIPLFYLLALTGDLVESLLKRSAGTKDSGSLLPGHGGFFDRLDGVLFASILSYLLLQ